jgi:hypothetical protein
VDELENLAQRAEAFEKSAEESKKWGEPEAEEKSEPLPDIDAAGNRVESIMKVAEAAAKMFLDNRLFFPDEEIEAARGSLSPVVQKYNLAGEGTGRLPYQEELTAGFYLGGLFKRFRRALAALKAADKAKAEKENQANQQANQEENNDGDERKHGTQEQPHVVPSEVGVWQESDPNAPKWLTL